jgi:hypothetical protein
MAAKSKVGGAVAGYSPSTAGNCSCDRVTPPWAKGIVEFRTALEQSQPSGVSFVVGQVLYDEGKFVESVSDTNVKIDHSLQ